MYTSGITTEAANRRSDEIESDLYEQISEFGSDGVLGRCVRGMAADVGWRIRTLRETARQSERNPTMATNTSRKFWLALVAVHIFLTAVAAPIGSPIGNPFGSSATLDHGFGLTLYVISVVGLVLMIVGLIVQRRRFVAGSWLFVGGLVPSLVSPTGLLVLASGAWTANLVFSDQMLDLPAQTTRKQPDVHTELGETTMDTFKDRWWRYAAAFIAVGFVFLGIGNLQGDDGGPLYGKVIAAAVAVGAAGLIVAGLAIRRRNTRVGSTLIGIGTLPASLLILFFWFPPVALVGVLAIAVTVIAFNDAAKQRHAEQSADVPA